MYRYSWTDGLELGSTTATRKAIETAWKNVSSARREKKVKALHINYNVNDLLNETEKKFIVLVWRLSQQDRRMYRIIPRNNNITNRSHWLLLSKPKSHVVDLI